MSRKAEQRYSIQCLDNATQMGQDELSILTCYVTLRAVISFRPCVCGCLSLLLYTLAWFFPYVVVRETEMGCVCILFKYATVWGFFCLCYDVFKNSVFRGIN